MRKTVLMIVFTVFLNTTYAQKYFGKSYPATLQVDEYFESSDVKKPYTVMGKSELLQGFRSLEKAQKKTTELAKKKGADGVIFSIEEEIYGTSSSSGGVVNEKKKDKTTASSNTTTTDMKQKKIKAVFIKYD
ncbi:hypothetical protein GJU39_22845 [Pedobacter petrophilus]|uniref:Uncharacterized protein n=1 Tax=Pedobacter petrophilus TaxID=1908241 RepID=A0A7K0G523_9SPHI|nr:hypothetical protein [Pedobacter petrophilus]MRX78908.1 hypothetical protein [Pedobacter petrophilus]